MEGILMITVYKLIFYWASLLASKDADLDSDTYAYVKATIQRLEELQLYKESSLN